MFRHYRFFFAAVLVLVMGLRIGAVVLVRPEPELDEALHLKVAEQFGTGFPSLVQLRSYGSATGPFFYVVMGNLGAIFAYDLMWLRLWVLGMAVASLFVFYRILKRALPEDDPLPALACLATAPYYAPLAGMLMTEHLALLLGLSSFLFYQRYWATGRMREAVLSVFLATLAVLTRVYLVFLPAAMFVSGLATRPRSWFRWLFFLLPAGMFLPLALFWRGLAPPSYQHLYHPGFSWQNLSSVCIWLGVSFFPWVRQWKRAERLASLLIIPVLLSVSLPGLGFTRTVLSLLPRPLVLVAVLVLGLVGLNYFLSLLPCWLENNLALRAAASGGLLLVLGLVISGPAVYERYMLPGYPFLLLCAKPAASRARALVWAGLCQFPLAVAHILHLSGWLRV